MKEAGKADERQAASAPAGQELVSGVQDRQKLIDQVTLIAGLLAVGAAGFYVYLYLQARAWQMLANVGLMLGALLFLFVARWQNRRRNFDEAGYWLIAAVLLAYGGGELLRSGLTLYNVLTGVLLILLVAVTSRSRRWGLYVGISLLYLAFVAAVNLLEPLPRFDASQSFVLRIWVPALATILLVTVSWQVVRAFRIGTIRTRLLIAFVTVVLAAIAILSGALLFGSYQSIRQRASDHLTSVALLKEGAVDTWLDNLLIDLGTTASGKKMVPLLHVLAQAEPDSARYEAARKTLDSRLWDVLLATGRFEELFVLDRQGRVVASTDPDRVSKLLRNQPYFRQGIQGDYIQQMQYSPTARRAYLHVARPIVDEQGAVMGVLVGRANLARLNEVMAESSGMGETGVTYLVGINHVLQTPSRDGTVNVWVSSEGIDRAVGEQLSGSGFYDDYNGTPVVGVYRWLPRLQSALLVEQAQSEALSAVYTMAWVTLAAALAAAVVAVVIASFITRGIANPLTRLAETATRIAGGDLQQTAEVVREDEIGTLARAFNSMTDQLRRLIAGLEERVAERTRALEQRSTYLEAAAEVGHAASSMLESEDLMQQTVDLIRDRFDLYYVGLFLVDAAGEWAVLRAGTGEAGQVMLARGHRLRLDEGSMIGWCVTHGEARIALEAGADAVRLATPELPETRSEAALPLISRGRVLGALTVQSTRTGAFDQDIIVVLQTMADQVAVALDNARLMIDQQAALEAVQRAYGELSSQAWRELLRRGPRWSFRSDERGVVEASDIWRPEMEQALREGRIIVGNGADAQGRQPLALPIKVRGEVIGVLDTYKPIEAGEWTEEELELLEQIVEQLDVALESARLHEEAQRRALQEETIRRVTEHMRRPREVEAVLQNTLAELTKALGVPRAYVRLGTKATLSPGEAGPGQAAPTGSVQRAETLAGAGADGEGGDG